jgi:hypothetical protein
MVNIAAWGTIGISTRASPGCKDGGAIYRPTHRDVGRQIIEQLYRGSDEKVGRLKAVAAVFKERTIDRTRRLFGDRGVELEQYIDQLSGYAQDMQRVQ